MVGKFETLKEARKQARVNCESSRRPITIYEERDKSYSIGKKISRMGKLVEAVDVSGRRFEIIYRHGKKEYKPKEKIQEGQKEYWMFFR